VNLYRRGPYYNEIHWLDVTWTNDQGVIFPARGEIIFYSYAESCRIGIVLHALENIQINNVSLVLNLAAGIKQLFPAVPETKKTIVFSGHDTNPLAWFSSTAPHPSFNVFPNDQLRIKWNSDSHNIPLKSRDKKQFDVGFIVMKQKENWDDLSAEITPLSGDQLTLLSGLQLKFDARRGDYAVSSHNPGGFSYHYYKDPNGYVPANIRLQNGRTPRKIYVRHEIGTGSAGQVECGVVLDSNHELLPVLVQISKNFGGEKEEKFYNPADTPFSELLYPLILDENETCELTSLQLYQNWGNHPLKQFSSLGAWMDYFHMSTGVTETTCYVPFRFYTGISIADLRGMSGRLWDSQPQHDNVGGHTFMEYFPADNPEQKEVMRYLGTSYHSTGPDWAHVTFNYQSSDGRILTEIETFEYPQLDELRNFIRLKIKALEDVPIRDWSRDFRIIQIDTHTQHLNYQNVTYIDPGGRTVTKPIAFNDSWTLDGAPMTKDSPVAVLWNSPKGNNAFIVQDWRGTIGGKTLNGLSVSCEGRKNGESNLILVPDTTTNGFVKGDQFEIDLFIMPFGKVGDDFEAAIKERHRYGLNPIRITSIQSGEVLSHFPPRIKADGDGTAFTIKGGYATVCVLVEGLQSYSGWRIQQNKNRDWKDVVHKHFDGDKSITGEGQQRFVGDDGTYGIGFRLKLDGKENIFRLVKTIFEGTIGE
jgi:hypothetical protein